MARRKRGRPAKIVQKSPASLLSTANRTSLIVGGVLVLVVLAGVAGFGYKYLRHHIPVSAPVKQTSSVSTTPAVSASPSVLVSVTQTANAPTLSPTTAQNQRTQSLVKKLPFTGGRDITYIVRENDSLAAIGEKFCNDNRAWLYLEQKNNLVEPYTLHPGDVIKIACQ